MSNEAAIALLYDNIHALPHEEYGVMNFLPFAHDSEQTRAVKRQMSEAIVGLFESHGMMTQPAPASPVVSRDVAVKCRTCATELVSLVTDEYGVAMVDAPRFIAQLSGSNPECDHAELTLKDMRLKMEREFYAAQEQGEAGE